MTDFEVIVSRISDDCGFGQFTSRVYAIDRDKMLVYDNGTNAGANVGIIPHFEWVDFTQEVNFGGKYTTLVQLKEPSNE